VLDRHLVQAINNLPAREREAFMLVAWDGFERDRAAQAAGWRPSQDVPQGVIVSSQPIDDHTVQFEVLPDGLVAPEWVEPTYSDIPCSEAKAARWR
jgi:hypothetical protein